MRILDDPHKGQAATINGEQIPIKKAWLTLRTRELGGEYDTDIFHWTCDCGTQKYHSYLLCKHLVNKVCVPPPEWWATIVRRHVPPFYDIRELLSPEDRAKVPEPEELGNYSWLARMEGMQAGPNAPTASTLPVCLVYV